MKNNDLLTQTYHLQTLSATQKLAAEEFTQRVQSIVKDKNVIKIGLIGEPGSGKSTFSNVITGLFPPKNGTLNADEYGQYSYQSETGKSVERVDLMAHAYENTSWEPKSEVVIIEHSNEDPNIEVDIEVSLSFLFNNQPVNVCDLEEELWQEHMRHPDQNIDASQTCHNILSSSERLITITTTVPAPM